MLALPCLPHLHLFPGLSRTVFKAQFLGSQFELIRALHEGISGDGGDRTAHTLHSREFLCRGDSWEERGAMAGQAPTATLLQPLMVVGCGNRVERPVGACCACSQLGETGGFEAAPI